MRSTVVKIKSYALVDAALFSSPYQAPFPWPTHNSNSNSFIQLRY